PESEEQSDNGNNHFSRALGEMLVEKDPHVAASQPLGKFVKAAAAEDIAGQINGNRVHAHPYERLAPSALLPYLDHLMKHGQQDGAVTAGDEHVRRGPNLFDDRKLHVPEPAENYGGDAGAEQIEH